MTTGQFVWSLLLIGVMAGLIMLPFWPAWVEWRRPRDKACWPLPAPLLPARTSGHGELRRTLRVPAGADFNNLQARQVQFGNGTPATARRLPALALWQAPDNARRWGPLGWHWPRALRIPASQRVTSALVVEGPLEVQPCCLLEGDVKAVGKLQLGGNCRVLGNLLGGSDITLGPGCRVLGLVLAEGRLTIAPDVVIGSPQQPVSVCADQIDVQGPVRIHGTVQARLQGHVARTPQPAQPDDPSQSRRTPHE